MPKQVKEYIKSNLANLRNIPVELQDRPQWVCWRLLALKPSASEGSGKAAAPRMAKVPVNPQTGSEASVTDKTTWSSCVAAVNLFGYKSGIMGIGFVFTDQ